MTAPMDRRRITYKPRYELYQSLTNQLSSQLNSISVLFQEIGLNQSDSYQKRLSADTVSPFGKG